jgi:tetratricopeptide (TPR) repeat protein
MLSQLIQQQVPLGGKVKFILTSGREISGILTEIGRDHVAIETETGISKLPIERIDFWEVPNGDKQELKGVVSSNSHVSEVSIEQEKESEDETSKNLETTEAKSLSVNQEDLSIDNKDVDARVSTITASSLSNFNPEVFRRLVEVEARFDASIKTSKIDLIPPSFEFPKEELKGNRQQEANKIWIRAKNKYENALKNNELGIKFGRLPVIVLDFKLLNEWFNASPSIRSHLGFLELISGNKKEALKHYTKSAILSERKENWYNLAVTAREVGDDSLACYALSQFFVKADLYSEQNQNAWYVYVGILRLSGDFSLLQLIAGSDGHALSEYQLLLETEIYLLKITERNDLATDLMHRWSQDSSLKLLVQEGLKYFSGELSDAYKKVLQDFSSAINKSKTQSDNTLINQPRGHIHAYKPQRNFGFIRGLDGVEYFFHKSAVIDEELHIRINRMETSEKVPVIFESTQGTKGLLAIGISLYRTIDELFSLATQYANDGEYAKAISQIRKVLAINGDYPEAQQLHEKWREYARAIGVPRGTNTYARAKRIQLIERDPERAALLLRAAIKEGDTVESAIKDLAQLLVQIGQSEEAIKLLNQNRKKITNPQTVDNLLINIYQKANQYEKAIDLLRRKASNSSNNEIKTQLLRSIASCYLKQGDYQSAESEFRAIEKLGVENTQINIAFCLIKQEHYDDAEVILNKILTHSADTQAAELLAAITEAKKIGQAAQIDEILVETFLSGFSNEVSEFTKFFLEKCEFQGVPPVRLQEQKFDNSDVDKLEMLATKSRTYRPRERSGYYLSAAKIISLIEEWDDPNQFHKYLCRSFASRGDAAVIENSSLDIARDCYCEALSVYDGYRSTGRDEQDAINSIVRFLASTLGHTNIPTTTKIPSIDEVLEDILNRHPNREQLFDVVAYVVSRSKFAANRILTRLYAKSTFQAMALEYLENKLKLARSSVINRDDFLQKWKELQRKKAEEKRNLSTEMSFIAKADLTISSLEDRITRIKGIESNLLFNLDQQRIRELQKVFEIAYDLCKQNTFEEKERYCDQIDTRCRNLLQEIENGPTKFSVESIYPILESLQSKANIKLQEVYESSVPQLTLRLAEGFDSYSHDANQVIEVQIVIENSMGCSPAESIELIVEENDEFFAVARNEINLDHPLRGGGQDILTILVRLTEEAVQSETFSLPIYAQYRTRAENIAQTQVANFSIRLYSEEQFEEIENPYAAYAESAIVQNKEMFYGRNELIENTARTIRDSHSQNKCLVIFGQKRSGKSSILHHLKLELQQDTDLLILDIGNIGSILDEYASTPLMYQILWSIVRKLQYAIEDKLEEGYELISIDFPTDHVFYEHPSTLTLFKDIFERFKRVASKVDSWQQVRIVLLIDEFSYIYSQIVNGRVSGEFMKNWKALLQENFFSAVLVGQDVMPKFKQKFPNEFGIIQDERVSYLKIEDAIKLIDEPIRIGGKQGRSRYVEKAIDRIVELTAGSPFYIQILCNRLVEYMNRKRAKLVTKSDVEQVKSELIQGVNALSIDKFDNLISSGDTSVDAISDEDARKVLASIAENSRTGACNRHSISCETQTPIDEILRDLENREVVRQEQENYYRIRVELFKEWLIAHPQ